MRIYTLWHADDDGEVPWIINAVDQYTVENNGEFPPPYLKHRNNILVREMIIDVPEDAVRALFRAPSVQGIVIKDDQKVGQNPVESELDELLLTVESELDELLLTAKESGNIHVIAAAYRLAAAGLRALGAEQHARDASDSRQSQHSPGGALQAGHGRDSGSTVIVPFL